MLTNPDSTIAVNIAGNEMYVRVCVVTSLIVCLRGMTLCMYILLSLCLVQLAYKSCKL